MKGWHRKNFNFAPLSKEAYVWVIFKYKIFSLDIIAMLLPLVIATFKHAIAYDVIIYE